MLRMAGAMLAAVSICASGDAGKKQEIERQLQTRYVPVRLGPGGQTVVSPGAILIVQAPGIRSNPVTQFTFMNNFQDGRIKHSTASSFITDRNSVRDLAVGEGVFLYKVEVKDNGVVFHVQPCGSCDFYGVDPSPFHAGITFQLPKNWLLSPDLNQVERLISSVFSIAGPQAPASTAPPPAAPPAPETNQGAPSRIEMGQSPEQVRAILGEPGKIVDLGNKKLFVYKDLKITFIDSKVVDVQ